MMLRLGFVLFLCVYGALAYRVDYKRQGMESGSTSEDRKECKKDIWILWDNSQSVGWKGFNDRIRPFVKKLITSPLLNVGPEGTHIGIITFATEKKTNVWLKIEEKQTPEELFNFLDGYDRQKYERELMGDGTRTGMAFKMADELFAKNNPDNDRAKVDDVVLMFTDGEPVRRTYLGEQTFGDKYKGRNGERLLAKDRADNLKDRGITVVGLAVGSESRIGPFRADIQSWVTTPVEKYYYEAKLEQLNSILNQLINSTCTDPGKCGCDTTEVVPVYTAQGKKALVRWLEPTLKCPSGDTPEPDSTVELSGYSSPMRFDAGNHIVTYTIGYWRGSKITKLRCPIEINVKNCECPSSPPVQAELQPGKTEAQVSWTVPEPNCKPTLKAVSRPGAEDGEDSFPVGEHTVTYNYEHNNRFGDSFTLSCPVTITVEGMLCGGIAFDRSTQDCCCGTIFDRQAHYQCCGPKYYDTRYQTCKDFYTLVEN